ncbi:MAG: hypothetical protein ACNA8G_09305 [Gammaproteobacteria bacterium]
MPDPNLELLEWAMDCLGPVAEDVVLVGGCATGLLITDQAAARPRVTRDVDVIAAITTLAQYHATGKRLRQQGFEEDTSEEALICRWKLGDLTLDLIPTNPDLLGFGNEWFEAAYREASQARLSSGKRLRHVTPPYFLATKLLAFDSRGGGDFMASPDIEDLVSVLDGRPTLAGEVAAAEPGLRRFLADRFSKLLASEPFLEALPGHLNPDDASQSRAPFILDRMREIATIAEAGRRP